MEETPKEGEERCSLLWHFAELKKKPSEIWQTENICFQPSLVYLSEQMLTFGVEGGLQRLVGKKILSPKCFLLTMQKPFSCQVGGGRIILSHRGYFSKEMNFFTKMGHACACVGDLR